MDKRITCSDCPLCNIGTDELCEGYCSDMADFIEEVIADAIDEYKRKLIEDVSQRAQANERVYSLDDANLFNYATRTFIDALSCFAEQLKEKKE